MRNLLVLAFICISSVAFTQQWNQIEVPPFINNVQNFDIAVNEKGETYLVYTNYAGGGLDFKVLKYKSLNQSWDTVYTYNFPSGYAQNLELDTKNGEIFASVQLNEYPEQRFYVFSIFQNQVTLVANPLANATEEYEKIAFQVGSTPNEFYWFAKKQYESKYFISRYNAGGNNLISDTLPNPNSMYFNDRKMALVGDTLWLSFSSELGGLHLYKKHKASPIFIAYDNSATGVFYHNSFPIISNTVSLIGNKFNNVFVSGKNQNDESFAVIFENGVASNVPTPPNGTFEQNDFASTSNAIYVASVAFDEVAGGSIFDLKTKDFASGNWSTVGSVLSEQAENNIRLAQSSLSNRFVVGSKYFDEVNYLQSTYIRVSNQLPAVGAAVFTPASGICANQTQINLTASFSVNDVNLDSLKIIGVTSSNNAIVPTNSLAYSTLSHSGLTTDFQLVGTTLAGGVVSLTITLTDGYDTLSFVKELEVGTTAQPIATDQQFCGSSSVLDLTATGTSVAWFSTNFPTNPLPDATPLTTAWYYFNQTVNGCVSLIDSIFVTVQALPTVQAGADLSVCAGQSVILNGSGASTYAWDLGVLNGVSFVPTATATYTVTGTDVNGCINTDQVVVTVQPLPTVQAGADLSVCAGQSVTLNGSGASTYAWDLGVLNGVSFVPTATATYTVTGTDASGCTNTDQVVVTVQPLPTVQAGADLSVCAGQSVTLNGSGASTYAWDLGVSNGVSFVPTATATYTVTGTDAIGCSNTDQVVVTVQALPTVQAGADLSVCAGQSVTLNGSGASTYAWDLGVSNGVSFVPTTTATYTVTGTDVNGCSNTDQVVVTVQALPTVQAGADLSVCAGQSVTLNGSGASTYAWDSGVLNGVSFVPTATATYTVTGTDANGCSNTDQVVVTVQALPTVQAGADLSVCAGQSVTINGSGASTYAWDLGVLNGISFVPTATATYTVTGTDANGCTNTDQVVVTVQALPTVQAGADLSVCAGQSVTLNGSGEGTLTWSNNVVNGELFSPTATATYTLTASDINGCVASDAVQVIVNQQPQIAISVIPTTCIDASGSATATLSGGAAPYTYYWSNGSQQQLSIQNLATGTYYLFVEDANACQGIGTAVIQPTDVTITPTISPVSCHGGSNGEIAVDIQGLPAPYSIYWSSGHSTNSVTNLTSGTYEFTAVSQSGCIATGSYAIPQPDPLQTDVTVVQPDCNTSNGSISVVGSVGGTPAYGYAWSNGGMGNIQSNLPADIYSITTTDGAGCQTINTIYLSSIGSPNIVGQVSLPTCEAPTGAIDVSVNSLEPFEISWSTGVTSEDISGLTAGLYTCTVTSDAGCVRVKGWNLKNVKPDVQEICLVTVDSVTTTNLIVWEKPESSIISHFGIYRETSTVGEYILIDTVHYSNLSVFNDVVASPLSRSWRYKISAFNFCGDESDLSEHHKTLHLNTFDQGGTATLVTWDKYEGASYNAFELWRFTNATGWELIETLGTTTFSFVDQIASTTEGLDYMVETNFDNVCNATFNKAQDFNKSRSNKERGLFDPGQGEDSYSNNDLAETNFDAVRVTLYPNPTAGEFTVELTEQLQLNYQLVSVTGTVFSSGTLTELANVFQLSYLESGIYYLRLSSDSSMQVLPFIIQK